MVGRGAEGQRVCAPRASGLKKSAKRTKCPCYCIVYIYMALAEAWGLLGVRRHRWGMMRGQLCDRWLPYSGTGP